MQIVLIAHNIRSSYNIGSLARSADCFGVKKIFCTGCTPYINFENDDRPPHIRKKISTSIQKTALGAEKYVDITHKDNIADLVTKLRSDGFLIVALEQDKSSVPIIDLPPTLKLALILGEETKGLTQEDIKLCDQTAEIPMLGQKESLNVSVAGAIALYELMRSKLY